MFSHLVLPMAAALLLSTGIAFAEDNVESSPPAATKEADKHYSPQEEIDTDGDGQVSGAESEAFSREQFAKIDADKDGKLSQGELESFHKDRKENRAEGKGKDKAQTKGDQIPAEMKEKMKARMEEERKARGPMMDTDGDGVVSEDEFVAHGQQRQNRMDVNGDGNVTKEEVMEMRQKRRAEHEQRRQDLRDKAGEGRERRGAPAETPAE